MSSFCVEQFGTTKSVPQNFYYNKNRDASPAIRGFVYQVDLTILRWLDLRTGQALELESGTEYPNTFRDRSSNFIASPTNLNRTNETY